jgi:hypothetical protein
MSNYNQQFAEQMAKWAKTKEGPPPIYNPEIAELPQPKKYFNLVEAITELANSNPALATWIYEYWSLKQDVRFRHREEKASLTFEQPIKL